MKILIIEDEQIIANRLLRMTQNFFGAVLEQIDHCESLSEGLTFIENTKIDLLLLDLNLNGEDGFEVLKNVVGQSFHTIIVSAYKDKAIEAFEYGVLDFVPKPFIEKRLHQALSRSKPTESTPNGSVDLKFLSIIKKGSHHLLDVSQLKYIKGARVYAELFLKDGTQEIHNKSLDTLIQLLPDHFERIHKSYIVDMKEVEALEAKSGGKYSVVLKSGDTLPVSRSKYKDLKLKWLI